MNKKTAYVVKRCNLGVENVKKLSTRKKARKMAKVTYTLTYPHYPQVFCSKLWWICYGN